MDSVLYSAIESTNKAVRAYCKFLSANDSGETGGHQAGILISTKAISMLFDREMKELNHIEKRKALIKWQDDIETESTFTYYESKRELRITSFGRNFPFLNKEDTGALFVFTETDRDNYNGYFLYTEDDINGYLEAIGISATETNNLIEVGKNTLSQTALTELEAIEISRFIESIKVDGIIQFPDSYTMSKTARDIDNAVYNHYNYTIENPDRKILL